MEKFTRLDGVAASLPMPDINTDAVIPASYQRTLTDDPGKGLMRAGVMISKATRSRFHPQPRALAQQQDHRRWPEFSAAAVRVNSRLGPDALRNPLRDRPSFGDIFYENSFKNGLLPWCWRRLRSKRCTSTCAHQRPHAGRRPGAQVIELPTARRSTSPCRKKADCPPRRPRRTVRRFAMPTRSTLSSRGSASRSLGCTSDRIFKSSQWEPTCRVVDRSGKREAGKAARRATAQDAFTARIIERMGFKAVALGGSTMLAARYALPDLGLAALAEMVETARDILAATDLPCIMDGDDGYGDVKSVVRMVNAYDELGVGAVVIEDQVREVSSPAIATRAATRCRIHRPETARSGRDPLGCRHDGHRPLRRLCIDGLKDRCVVARPISKPEQTGSSFPHSHGRGTRKGRKDLRRDLSDRRHDREPPTWLKTVGTGGPGLLPGGLPEHRDAEDDAGDE